MKEKSDNSKERFATVAVLTLGIVLLIISCGIFYGVIRILMWLLT
jgi:hypothetical protein